MPAQTRRARPAPFVADGAAGSPPRGNRRGAASRARILAAARRILVKEGYAALSMARLRVEAGVSSASLYHHFRDKAAIVAAALEETVNENARRFRATRTDDGPLADAERFFDELRAVRGEGASDTAALLAAAAEAGADSPETAEVAAKANRYAERVIAENFADYFDIEDGRLFAHLHIAFAFYMTHAEKAGFARAERAAIFASLRALVLLAGAATRPDFYDDADFAAAVKEATPRRARRKGEKS
ncbi:TetR/AcrR family transcriptional regulator [Amphiplicatus metriothermophilus]|uniref:Transcriptional regulator, TetR family n=1 Tax=Amphiplicatus metriothermophilus TaxID=1519374 RepID=A0A239PJS7_9PROT|nr:TetR/AcrR family transcriptional regulator [Amphiplicatus metriothermophilus]MBB5517605.1 AcrR family transcriptional regulator [Amphiplicatus metriothermophilus]SNT68061.1 transcriptional regulator, TetR family [Amphiplicatus metriothermophilus]